MQLIRGTRHWPAGDQGCVATIGNFDGVHRGHQAIFEQVFNVARERGLPACVISFEPLPHEYFAGLQAPGRLQGLRNRVHSLDACGIDRLLLLSFNAQLAAQSAEGFAREVLVQHCQVQHLVVGHDFRFGHARQGDHALLQALGEQCGFSLERSATVMEQGERISSTRVRDRLLEQQLAAAANLLGRPYRLSGRVVHGEKVGRQLGFPTANIALKGKRPPLRGVFAVTATLAETGRAFAAVANLGERPTVDGRRLLLEVHLLGEDRDLYGQHLHVDFLHFIRGEQRFSGLDELKAQIGRDAQAAGEILSALERA